MYPRGFAMGVHPEREADVFPFAFVGRNYCPEVLCLGGFHFDLKCVQAFGECE